MLRLPAVSKEFVKTTVTASADPTSQPPSFAFTATSASPDAWLAGEWVDETTYDARILIGPESDVELDAGFYFCWLKVISNPEIPVRVFDILELM